VLGDVRRGAYADRSAERRLDGLAGRDRNLAVELAFGAIRLRGRLDAELEIRSARPLTGLDPRLLDALRLGLYQLRETRIPAHAAVHETVGHVRQLLGGGAAGLANAVLRRAAEEGVPPGAWPDPDRDPVGWLVRYGSHPEWLIRRWLGRWPLADVRALVENDNRPPDVTLRILREDAAGPTSPEEAAAGGASVRVEELPGHPRMVRLREGDPADAIERLCAVAQDPAASAVVDYVGVDVAGPLLDGCAAPGGKLLGVGFLATHARPLVAGDVNAGRLRAVRRAIARTGLRAHVVVMDARRPAVRIAGTVLLDVPCSGTGVLRRRPDARWRITPRRLAALTDLQEEMLEACAERVRPAGLLVYSTCSLEPEENEGQVEGFLSRNPGWERAGPPAGASFPDDWITPEGDLRVLPWTRATDGAFASRLRRRERGG
jgi:16S rRNA (cytosine967-C5)-methyltransferase